MFIYFHISTNGVSNTKCIHIDLYKTKIFVFQKKNEILDSAFKLHCFFFFAEYKFLLIIVAEVLHFGSFKTQVKIN